MDNQHNTRAKQYDVITLGESMIRLSPPGALRLGQSAQLDAQPGGSEANVAIALARLGRQTAWLSRLPENPMGHLIADDLRRHGVDVRGVRWAEGERVGLYFVEFAGPPRGIRVWYDRANSAASRLTPADLDITMLTSTRWFHVTGITFAISASAAETARAALVQAKAAGAIVSVDVNYRAMLWSPAEAAQTLDPICGLADYVMVAARDAALLFGTREEASEAAAQLQARWGSTLIVTAGSGGAAACDGTIMAHSEAFETTMADRVGAGDAMNAGVIDQLLDGNSLADALRFGAALAALKMTIPGDAALISRAEVEAVLRGGRAILR